MQDGSRPGEEVAGAPTELTGRYGVAVREGNPIRRRKKGERREEMAVRPKRASEPAKVGNGYRVLVGRIWPRGVSGEEARLAGWPRELAPSGGPHRRFGHNPERFEEFRRGYLGDLAGQEAMLAELRRRARKRTLTLVSSSRDREHNDDTVVPAGPLRGRSG